MPSYSSANGVGAVLGGAILIWLIISLALIIFAAIIYWRIFSKAGYSGAMGLLMFIPIANVIVLCVLAFGEWPIYKELRQLRQMAARIPQPGYMPYPQNPQYNPQNPSMPPNPQYRG